MRAREKPKYIRTWILETFPWITGVLKCNETQGFLGYWLESYTIRDFDMLSSGGHGVDYYFDKFQGITDRDNDLFEYLRTYPIYRHTASGLRTLLVTAIHGECPFCVIVQENAKGICNFMDVVFPGDFYKLDLFVNDLEAFLERCPIPLPIPHKGTLCPVTQRVTFLKIQGKNA